MAVDPARIDAMRRAGELIAVREPGSIEWRYPAWQFESGKPRPAVARVVAAARESGVDESRLYDVLTMQLGLRDGGGRLVDLLLAGPRGRGRRGRSSSELGRVHGSRANDRDVTADRLDVQRNDGLTGVARGLLILESELGLETSRDRRRIDPRTRSASHTDTNVARDGLRTHVAA